jgi:acyl-CoA dehydrogenase
VSLDALRREVRAFLAGDDFTPRSNAWMDGHDPAFSRRLAARGWVGMTWPVELGGGGRTPIERYAVTEELLAAGAPVAAHWFADRQVGPQLLRFGTDEQRRRYLPAMARAECLFAIGMSEPDAGSDLAAVRTVAEREQGGWRVSGTKVWTSHAHAADHMVTLCRTAPRGDDRHAGLTQLIVDLRANGVDVRPIEGIDGEAHFCEVILDGVRVDDRDVLGEPGAGWRLVTAELAHERSGPERFLSTFPLLVACVGRAGDDDAERLGRAFAGLFALRGLSFGVASQLARGEAPDVAAALVKDLGTRFEQELVETLRGLAPPDAYGRAQLAAPSFTLRGGASEILRGIVGRELTA